MVPTLDGREESNTVIEGSGPGVATEAMKNGMEAMEPTSGVKAKESATAKGTVSALKDGADNDTTEVHTQESSVRGNPPPNAN